jgi:hypothetical protein
MMPEPVVVDVEGPLQQEVAALLIQSDSVAAWLYPGEYRRPITPEFLAKSGTHVLIARLGGTAVGLCVVFERDDGAAEVKRMIVDEGAEEKVLELLCSMQLTLRNQVLMLPCLKSARETPRHNDYIGSVANFCRAGASCMMVGQ